MTQLYVISSLLVTTVSWAAVSTVDLTRVSSRPAQTDGLFTASTARTTSPSRRSHSLRQEGFALLVILAGPTRHHGLNVVADVYYQWKCVMRTLTRGGSVPFISVVCKALPPRPGLSRPSVRTVCLNHSRSSTRMMPLATRPRGMTISRVMKFLTDTGSVLLRDMHTMLCLSHLFLSACIIPASFILSNTRFISRLSFFFRFATAM